MNAVRELRRHLGSKLFVSYVLVIVVGAILLWITAHLVAPAAFEQHLAAMTTAVGRPEMIADLFESFVRALNTALVVAAGASVLAAIIVSVFVTRRIAAPINAMSRASARIADGRYEERVPATSDDELGRLAGQFNRMAATLQRVEQMRRDLIADVAHELRTPLASISGYLEALMDGVIPSEPETFHRLYRETTRLQRLVADLQELSRVEAGQVPVNLRPAEVGELLDAAVARLRAQFEEKGVELTVDVAPGLPRVLADPDRIGQVLTNLLGNALQYTPAAGRVEVRARLGPGAVAIAVSDSGIGIAPEHLPHVFDRFYRVDRSRARASGGSGIGLTIARHLVEAHGGTIKADSPGPGQGATFTFTLPAVS